MKIQAHYKWWIAGELNFVVKIHVLIFCTKQDLMKVGKKASSGSFLRNPRSRFFSLLFTMLVGHDMHEFVKTWKTCAKWEYKIKTWYCKAPQMRSLLVLVQLISFTKQGMFDDMLHICFPDPSFKFNIQPAVQQHPQTPYSEDHPRTWT